MMKKEFLKRRPKICQLLFRVVSIVLCLMPSIATAQHGPICGAKEKIIQHLARAHQEVPTEMGLDNYGQLIQVLTSKKGTWTMISINPNGKACLKFSGQAWKNFDRMNNPKLDLENPR